jgi:hypothetical protein
MNLRIALVGTPPIWSQLKAADSTLRKVIKRPSAYQGRWVKGGKIKKVPCEYPPPSGITA